jgi:antitoxin (DNA-binding transcriptional repressor) of toxin-antitoxin stability system
VKKIELNDSPRSLASTVHEAEGEPVFITVDGQVVAAIVRASDDDLEEYALARNPVFRSIVERSRTQYEAEGGMTLDEAMASFGVTQVDLDNCDLPADHPEGLQPLPRDV